MSLGSYQTSSDDIKTIEESFASAQTSKNMRRLPSVVSVALLLLLPLIYFFPAVIGKITLVPGDGLTQNLGVRVLIGQMIANGQLPLWNPYIFAGMPLLASIYPGALYPPNWLFALFSPATAMNIVVITTYHITIIGVYLYARRVGMTRVGALIAGTAFTFGGYMIAHMGHTSRIAAAAWLPWILLAIEHLYIRITWRWIAFGAAFVALQLLAGEPQMNFYTILVCGAYVLFSLKLREEIERRRRFLFGVIAMSFCGALLSAIQLLPERELLQMSERAAISYEYFSGYSFPPAHVLTFVFPFFFGGAMLPIFTIPYWATETIDETCGYFGLLTLLLALIALVGSSQRSLVRFWVGVALVSLILAFGGYLPFGLNHILHHMPVYNLFRASGRHMYEFTLSVALLAGFGASYIAQIDRQRAKRALLLGSFVFIAIVALTSISYRFFNAFMIAGATPPGGANSLMNLEALIPIGFAALSLIVLSVYARWPNAFCGAVLIAVIFCDLAIFGLAFNFDWRNFITGVNARLQDRPAVQFIKSREKDLNTFRIVSYSPRPFGKNYDAINFPNVSIARGLQSINGYDALRPLRPSAISGDMSWDGLISDLSVFGPDHQGLNLLNVKYLLRERHPVDASDRIIEIEGIRFNRDRLNLNLIPGSHAKALPNPTLSSELAIVSLMAHSVHIPDDTLVVRIKLHDANGRVVEREIKAGRDTAEWAYNREDARGAIKHRQPRIAEIWPADGFQAQSYLARIPFDRTIIERIEFDYALPEASVLILQASLFDSATGISTPLDLVDFQKRGWRKLEKFDDVEVYENLKLSPRAWFVRRAIQMSNEEVLRTIKSGRLKDGSAFDPAETVLFGREDYGNREIALPQIGDPTGSEVKITRYEPQRIELQARNSQTGFLVLSEIYYRGWEAWIDGHRAPVERVNYALRGLAVPAGEHQIEFVFRAHSFRNGAAYLLLGVLLLLLGAGNRTRRTLTKIESRLEGPATRISNEVKSRLKILIPRVLTRIEMWLSALSKSRFVIVAAVIGLLIYGYVVVRHASYSVGGSDSSGYGNLARSILKGVIVQPVVELDQFGLQDYFAPSFIPLGYDPGPRPRTMSPIYPLGLPLHMAIGALIAGWDYGPFLVSPLTAVLSLILIYMVGLELGLSRGYSIVGAVMLGASPTFLYMSLAPMSDVAATFWALLTIWASLRTRKRDGYALLAGAALGIGFLVRPSNILLLVPLLFILRLKPRTLLFFFLGGLPFAAVFFSYNTIAFGHPMRTGYVATRHQDLMMTTGFVARFNFYVYWMAKTMSPWLLLGWLGVAANRKVFWRQRAMLITWFGVFLLFYACYDIYGDWWYTRFLLPAYPAMILGALMTTRDVTGLLKRWVSERNQARLSVVALAILLAAVLSSERHYIRRFNLFITGDVDSVNAAFCLWTDRMLPDQAVVASMEMSGALKFYTRRLIVRWDLIPPDQWQSLKERAAERGHKFYALLMPQEVEEAKKRLPGRWVQMGTLRHMSLWRIETTS